MDFPQLPPAVQGRFSAIATDYDGTLATDGRVDRATLAALEGYRDRGGTLIMVTGRELDELFQVFPAAHLFASIVAENGAVLYNPQTLERQLLGDPPPAGLIDRLEQQQVTPISVGEVVVATWQPHGETVEATLRDLNLSARVIFNKRAVMVLPEGIDKASGLQAALRQLNIDPATVAAIGDAENDQDLLAVCGLGVAVANALDSLKAKADYVTPGDRGQGVQELIGTLLSSP
ncbi:haloacid dehalogenase [filamentous cyanobacterium CCP5]|nr:haloacid dehalogenase [filamentous cyanobacterium CCP5]